MRFLNKIIYVWLLITLLGYFNFAKASDSGLMKSAWPMFHGDSKLTGQSLYDTSKIGGAIKWKFQAEGQVETSPVIDAQGNIYFVDQKCHLYSVSPEGKERWKFKAGDPVISKEWGSFGSCAQSTPAIDAAGTIYFLPMTGNFYAINNDGKEKWRYPVFTFKNAWPSPAIATDGTIYVGSESYPPPETGKPQEKSALLYAFNPDGSLKWTFDPGGSSWVNSAPSIADDGTIYVTGNDCKKNNCANGVIALNPNGTTKWQFFPPNGVLEGSVTIGSDGGLYFTAKGSSDPRQANFYALKSDGTLKWKFPLPNGASITPGLSKDGKLYFGDWGGVFYALDLEGKELWRVQTPQAYESLSSSPAIGAEGTFYYGTIANYFYAFTSDGKEKWKMKISEGGVGSSPAIGPDGTVYFLSIPGVLYAMGEGKAEGGNASVAATADDLLNGNVSLSTNNILTYVLAALLLLMTILIFWLVRRSLTKQRLLAIGTLSILLIAGLGYLIFYPISKPLPLIQTNQSDEKLIKDQPKTFEEVKGTCPRRVYGSASSGHYGIYEMQQIVITEDVYQWVKKNCPNTYLVGEGEVGRPIGEQ